MTERSSPTRSGAGRPAPTRRAALGAGFFSRGEAWPSSTPPEGFGIPLMPGAAPRPSRAAESASSSSSPSRRRRNTGGTPVMSSHSETALPRDVPVLLAPSASMSWRAVFLPVRMS
ncbi:hypothetical protein CTA2_847 [Colletotrichum tanaceti]|nr:hypothetical protein CTA2_847 [Colletotrichum tanaceti]